MRGTVAKKIRRLVYGDASLKTPRTHKWVGDRYGNPICIVVEGFRAAYQKSKQTYKEAKAKGVKITWHSA